ncbi:MAG: dynamin family protein [Patescibacteria group bacterium]
MNIENKTDTIDERIENTKKLVGKFIEENDSLSSLGDYKDYIEKAINELKTTKEELEKETYMLLVVGGVKSGKSSLINALIGKESTIAKTGVETTIYPSIISSSKQDEIVVYEKRSGDEFKDDEHSDANAHDEEEAELIGVVINDIKGLSSAKNALVSKGIKKKIVDLNRDKIEKYVTSANREPNVLLINIRIQPKEDSIINNNTFIIDTPGIDGVIAGLSGTRRENESSKVDNNSKTEEELIKKSEYIIFMRSSLTPLPREGIKLFKESQYLTKRTIFFIHNKFTINPWRLTEDDSSEQIEKDRKIFSDFGIKPNPKIIDLGKANDAILNKPELKDKESYEQLLDDSKLKELEEDIKDAISRNGKQTHLDTQVSNLETNL